MYEVRPVPVKDCNGVFLTSRQLCPQPSCNQALACLYACSGLYQHHTSDKYDVVPVTHECTQLCKVDRPFLDYCGYIQKYGWTYRNPYPYPKQGYEYYVPYQAQIFNCTVPIEYGLDAKLSFIKYYLEHLGL